MNTSFHLMYLHSTLESRSADITFVSPSWTIVNCNLQVDVNRMWEEVYFNWIY